MNAVAQRPRGPIARFFIAIWDTVNFTRRLILNMLFFGLLLIVLAALGARGHKPALAPLDKRTTLIFAPEGRIVEEDTRDALTRLMAANSDEDPSRRVVRLRDLLAVLDAARKEPSIERVFVDVDRLYPSGFASTRDVAAALRRVRDSGKEVIAFSEGMTQGQYLIASQASQLFLDPDGHGLLLEGLASYRPYMREGLQDKLGIDFHLFKVGEYKSAAEPYVRDSASPEAKEADLFWMNDLWQRYLQDIASARKLDAGALKNGIDGLADGVVAAQGDLAQYALNQKWVDGLKTRAEVETLLTQRGVADEDAEGGFRQVAFTDYLSRTRRGVDGKAIVPSGAQVAVVVAEGEIVPGRQSGGQVGGESTAELLREAREDDDVKAVVLRVNSPGGEVFASEQIRREVAALKTAKKPVVVSMGDVAASGGYWISMNAERIYADPSTITGSIGIFGLVPNLSRALGKVGVHTDGVATAPLAGAEDVTRPLDPNLAKLLQSVIEKGYRDFTGKVAQARGKPVAEVDAVARGRVWSGAQAKERGLVDAFGGLQDALDFAAQKAGLKKDAWHARYIEQRGSTFDQFLSERFGARLGIWALQHSSLMRGMAEAGVEARLQRELANLRRVMSDGSTPVRAMADCQCALPLR